MGRIRTQIRRDIHAATGSKGASEDRVQEMGAAGRETPPVPEEGVSAGELGLAR